MHAVMITFRTTAPLDALVGPFTAYAHGLRAVPGLLGKTWLAEGATLGGFHLFADRRAADAYLDGAMVAGLAANPAFSGFQIAHYGVLDDLSRITGGAQPLAPARGDRPPGDAPAPPGAGR